MKRRFFTACAVFTLAACCLLALRLLTAPQKPAPAAPTPAPGEPGPTLAFFGLSADPWYEPLFDQVERWTKEQNWSLISYDCWGNPTAQKGQMEDLVTRERADVALVCIPRDASPDAEEDLAERLALLKKAGVPALTLTDRAGPKPAGTACHLAPADGALYDAAAAALKGTHGVLLVADLPEDAWTDEVRRALEAKGVDVLHYGACWGSAEYAKDYLRQALVLYPEADGILTASLAGALGAKEACPKAKVVRTGWDADTAEALALGRLDAAVGVPPAAVFPALTEVLPKAAEGAAPKTVALACRAFTPADADAPWSS